MQMVKGRTPGEIEGDPGPDEEDVNKLIADAVTDFLESNKGYVFTQEEITESLFEMWDLDNITDHGSNTPPIISSDLEHNYLGAKIEDLLDDLEMHNQLEKTADDNGVDYYGIVQ